MGQTKKAIYKVHNGTDFDTIHFETEASLVKTNSGSNVETVLSDMPNKKNILNPTLLNYWINSDTVNYFGAEVWKDSMNYVHIRGMIQVTQGGTDSTVPFWLPPEYRPVKNYDMPISSNLTTTCYVRIRADGAVVIYTPNAHAMYINFGELIFRAGD